MTTGMTLERDGSPVIYTSAPEPRMDLEGINIHLCLALEQAESDLYHQRSVP